MLCQEHINHHVLSMSKAWWSSGRDGLTANFMTHVLQEPASKVVLALREMISKNLCRVGFCSGYAGQFVWPKPYSPDKQAKMYGYMNDGTPITKDNIKDIFVKVENSASEYPGAFRSGRRDDAEYARVVKLLNITPNQERVQKRSDCRICKTFPYKGKGGV